MESQRTTYIEHDNSDLGEVQISNDVLAVIFSNGSNGG